MTDLMPGPGYTWDHDDIMGVYTLTRRIWIGRDMTVLEMHRRLQEFLDTCNGILWDQVTNRLTDEIIEWCGDPYEIVGPGRLHSGSIVDRRNNDVVMYLCELPGAPIERGACTFMNVHQRAHCNCTADHNHDQCGPPTRDGGGLCWWCKWLGKCREQEA